MDDIIQAVAGLRRDDLRQAQRRLQVRAAAQHRQDGWPAAHAAAGMLIRCRRWVRDKRQASRLHTRESLGSNEPDK